MKSEKDRFTAELPMPGAKARVGRPPKPDALSAAERARRYRAKKKASPGGDASTEKIYTQADYEVVQRAMIYAKNSMWKMEGTILAMQKEQALLIEERSKLFAEVERLQKELASKS